MVSTDMFKYAASEDVLVYLINETVNGRAERRLAADFILHCMRTYPTREEIEHCIDTLEDRAIIDVAGEVRQLASSLGLVA